MRKLIDNPVILKPIIANRNIMCPFDFYGLDDADMVRAHHDGRIASIQTRICPYCGRRYISLGYIDDLKKIRIKGVSYYNLNLPEYRQREMIELDEKGRIVVKKKEKSIEEKILDTLKENQPLYPKVLARMIGEDKETVRDYLYSNLGNSVFKDDEHYWWIRDGHLRWKHNKTYYIADYVKYRYWRYRDDNELEDTKLILDAKKGKDEAINRVADKLKDVVSELIDKYVNTEYLIIAPVPSSDSSRNSPMFDVAERIREHCYFDGEILVARMFSRMYDVPAAHAGERLSYSDQKSSILCLYPHFCTDEFTCIILDDITTTGTMMNVCSDILIENGMPYENIIRLAFAKTGG